jgi:hypothetical protein
MSNVVTESPVTTKSPLASDVLKRTRNLISSTGWTQGDWARDNNGGPVHYNSDGAKCFCLSGAVRKTVDSSIYSPTYGVFRLAHLLLLKAGNEFVASKGITKGKAVIDDVPILNDHYLSNQDDALAVLDKAIEYAEAAEPVAGILFKGRDLLNNGENWYKGYFAKDAEGCSVEWYSRDAVCYCTSGALNRVSVEGYGKDALVAFTDDARENEYKAERVLLTSFNKLFGTEHKIIPHMNDDPSTTFTQLKDAFEHAIRSAYGVL